MPKRWDKALALVGAILIVAFCFLLFEGPGGRWAWLILTPPGTRDPRLVGVWTGTWHFLEEPEPRSKVTVFRADGTGTYSDEGRYQTPFEWGTRAGVLYTRRMATDAWSGRKLPYELSPDGKALHFRGARKMFDLVTEDMHKQ
ncbi:MAG TPA: hypothetical protein VKT78_02550 [Fimbriimonadaceae bacterium]|nr:hypothetical protein [Fimbriimonadaceae bacterium]